MMKSSKFAAALTAVALAGFLPILRAQDIPGITLSATLDPSPGTDVFAPHLLRLNHATHKIYVAGLPSDSTRNFGLKVVDATSFTVTAGIDLGRYTGSFNGFYPIGLDVDESAAPVGDKIYVIGRTDGSPNAILRVIDGPSNTNLTGENTDLPLPVGLDDDNAFANLAVNAANQKVYVSKTNGEIVIVDGPNRQILKTIAPNFGDFLIANPAANKIFVVNHNGGGVINSTDDTFTPLSLFFTAVAATLDSVHGRIYFVGKALNNSNAIYAVDATTGAIVGSKTDLTTVSFGVAVDPGDNTLYLSTLEGLIALNTSDFSLKKNLGWPALNLVCDPTVSRKLFYVESYDRTARPNLLHALDPDPGLNGVRTDLALGYRPFEMAVNSRTNRIYVSDEQTAELLAVDRNFNGGITRIPVFPSASINHEAPWLQRVPRHLAVSERLNRIYLPRRQETIFSNEGIPYIDVCDGATNQYSHSITLDSALFSADFVLVDDTRRRFYVVAARRASSEFETEKLLLIYNADTETLLQTISLGTQVGFALRSAAMNPVTGRVYIVDDKKVDVVDGNTNTKIASIDVGVGPDAIAVNRRTNKIYVGTSPNSVTVINGATNSVETVFPSTNLYGNNSVDDIAVDEVTNRVYVADAFFGSNQAPQGGIAAFDANNDYAYLGQTVTAFPPTKIAVNNSSRELFLSHDLDGVISVFKDDTPAPADIFGNISTRAYVGSGDNVLIGGFIIYGPSPFTKKVMIRAIGPSLTQAGVAGALQDTTLEVHDGAGNVFTNDNWKISDATNASQQAEIEATGIPPSNDKESALVMTLPAGRNVTAIVRGKDGGEGLGLVEVYDLDRTLPAKLVNISTRGHAGLGDNVMIAGVIIVGSKPVNVILHALGPSLASSGVPNPLEDPVLELRDPNGGLIATNDDWQEHEAEVNATLLPPKNPRESAIVARLFPANYTAIARGKNGGTGVALVDAYYQIIGQ